MASSPDNPSASVPPRSGSGSTPEIDPQLEDVLRNLNVNLEDELTRYRRQRHGRVPPPPPPRRMAQRHTIDLISVPASSEKTSDEAPENGPAGLSEGPLVANDLAASSLPVGQRPTPPPAPPNPFLDQEAESEAAFELPDLDPEKPPLDLAGLAAGGDPAAANPNPALPVPANDTPTESYLESSEELLKSIADDQAEPDSLPDPYSPERKNNGLLKLAGLILVLLGGVGVGFAITYPSQLQKLRSQFWPAGTEIPDATAPDTTAPDPTAGDGGTTPGSTTAEVAPDGYKPPGPDLSTREFEELDLESLSTLDVDGAAAGSPTGSSPTVPSPTGAAPASSPLPNPAQTPIPAAAPTPAEQPAASPTAPAPVPTTPAAAPTAAAPDPTAATGANFYVIASYTGDASLNKARELVPDAFVRNFQAGARIQLAAFDNRAQAEDQVAALTQQGVTAELFGPTNE